MKIGDKLQHRHSPDTFIITSETMFGYYINAAFWVYKEDAPKDDLQSNYKGIYEIFYTESELRKLKLKKIKKCID